MKGSNRMSAYVFGQIVADWVIVVGFTLIIAGMAWCIWRIWHTIFRIVRGKKVSA